MPSPSPDTSTMLATLAQQIKQWGHALGFAEICITDTDLSRAKPYLAAWLAKGMHGKMAFMQKHDEQLRAHPEKLVPGTLRVISARMNYLPRTTPPQWQQQEWQKLEDPEQAVVSVYARGRDYHRVLRSRLQKLAQHIQSHVSELGYRVFTDSAPILEVELARKAGLGWRGKHTLLLSRTGGSFFFLGEIFVDIPLPTDPPVTDHCGNCQRCIDICPTKAIIAPYQLDARRCISYLTIEHPDAIPEPLRPLLGNRIYGCDDCQLICPWNKYAQFAQLDDFMVRHHLDNISLVALFNWSEAEFLNKMTGSAIRRIGHIRWLRNIAVALGNALRTCTDHQHIQVMQQALQQHLEHPHALVREHVIWALKQLPDSHSISSV